MTWEYKTLSLPVSEQRQEMLSEMGLAGWELIGFEQGLAYFKREKVESVQPSSPSAPDLGIPTTVAIEDFDKAYHDDLNKASHSIRSRSKKK
jgi:hypothetical protein